MADKNKGIIILTDPDFAGNEIRKYIHKFFPEAKDAYIARSEGTKDGDIGIENAKPDAIICALEKARCTYTDREDTFTMEDLIENGLNGGTDSKLKREAFTKILGIGYSNSKQLLSKLNRFGITREEFDDAIKKLYQE